MIRKTSRRVRVDARRKIAIYGAVVAVVCFAAGAGVFGTIKLWRAVTGMEEFVVHPGDVTIDSEWVNPERARLDFMRTDPTGVLQEPRSLFTSDLAQRVADAYASSPWVKRVVYVRRVFPNKLDIKLQMREPFTLVRTAGDWYCLDEDGVLLSPRIYRLTKDRYPRLRPYIVFVNNPPAPSSGEVWQDAAVHGGMALARHCHERLAGKVNVARIEVLAEGAPGYRFATAWLVLDTGTRVRWGRTPGFRPSPAETPTLQKTAALIAWAKTKGAKLARRPTIDVTQEALLINPLTTKK